MTSAHSQALGLPAPFFRHALVVLAGVAAVLGAAYLTGPAAVGGMPWLVLPALVGVLAGVIARGWLGALFLLVGTGLGLLILLAWRFGLTETAAQELNAHAAAYGAPLAAGAVGYTIAAVALALSANSRSARR